MDMKNDLPRRSKKLFFRPAVIGAVLLVMVVMVHFPLIKNFSRRPFPGSIPTSSIFAA